MHLTRFCRRLFFGLNFFTQKSALVKIAMRPETIATIERINESISLQCSVFVNGFSVDVDAFVDVDIVVDATVVVAIFVGFCGEVAIFVESVGVAVLVFVVKFFVGDEGDVDFAVVVFGNDVVSL